MFDTIATNSYVIAPQPTMNFGQLFFLLLYIICHRKNNLHWTHAPFFLRGIIGVFFVRVVATYNRTILYSFSDIDTKRNIEVPLYFSSYIIARRITFFPFHVCRVFPEINLGPVHVQYEFISTINRLA